MYHFLKNYLKVLMPKKLLIKNELIFRKFYGFFYKGNIQQCNICDRKLKRFVSLKNNDLLCPFCGSLSRNRRLWNILEENNALFGNILHFLPSRSLFRSMKIIDNINYFSSDFEDEFLADYKFNIKDIKASDEKFDTIICYHILEHIDDDIKGMKELYRVLKPNGNIYIQTPFKEGAIYEDYSITSPELREKHFGQDDHVRIYSVEGLKTRLQSVGFNVNIRIFKPSENDFYNGFKSPETILIASKE